MTSIGKETFRGCSRLTSITIPDSVISIGDRAFSDCASLIDIALSNHLEYIGSEAFSYCKALTSVTIPAGVKSIYDYTFSNCESLGEVRFAGNIESIGFCAFQACRKLPSLCFPDSPLCICQFAFLNCDNLGHLVLPAATTIYHDTFQGCPNLILETSNGVCSYTEYIKNLEKQGPAVIQIQYNEYSHNQELMLNYLHKLSDPINPQPVNILESCSWKDKDGLMVAPEAGQERAVTFQGGFCGIMGEESWIAYSPYTTRTFGACGSEIVPDSKLENMLQCVKIRLDSNYSVAPR